MTPCSPDKMYPALGSRLPLARILFSYLYEGIPRLKNCIAQLFDHPSALDFFLDFRSLKIIFIIFYSQVNLIKNSLRNLLKVDTVSSILQVKTYYKEEDDFEVNDKHLEYYRHYIKDTKSNDNWIVRIYFNLFILLRIKESYNYPMHFYKLFNEIYKVNIKYDKIII